MPDCFYCVINGLKSVAVLPWPPAPKAPVREGRGPSPERTYGPTATAAQPPPNLGFFSPSTQHLPTSIAELSTVLSPQ